MLVGIVDALVVAPFWEKAADVLHKPKPRHPEHATDDENEQQHPQKEGLFLEKIVQFNKKVAHFLMENLVEKHGRIAVNDGKETENGI